MEEDVKCRLLDRCSLCPDGKAVAVWIGDKLKVFASLHAAGLAFKAHLGTRPSKRKAAAKSEVRRRLREFREAQERDETLAARERDDEPGIEARRAASRNAMERYVAHLLVAMWTRDTGLPAFVVNDFAVADIVFCLNTEFEAYLGTQLKTCGGLREDGQLQFQDMLGYTGLLVICCIRSTLEFLSFSGKDLDLWGKQDLAFVDKPKSGEAGKGEKLNLALDRLGLEDLVKWIYRNFAAPLANRGKPLPAKGRLVGPKGKVKDGRAYRQSILATPTDYIYREIFAGVNHRKEWRSFLGAMAYLVKSGQLTPGMDVSFADAEGAPADFFINGEHYQAKSLRATKGAGVQCSLATLSNGEWVKYHSESFKHLILVYWVGSVAYIWIISMQKLVDEGYVGVEKGEKGKPTLTVHMSKEQQAKEHQGVDFKPLKNNTKLKWTIGCYEGSVDMKDVLH